MSIFKCKMCGGDLEIAEGASVAECQYCGSKQTLPRFDSDRKRNLYDRANHFRRNNEFDKAEGIYEQILNEDSTDAEAYWSLVLCRYGIEYVEDPATHKRIPTVNRAQYTSVFADENYKKAVGYADTLQRELYEAEAKAIEEIQRGILEISEKEEPFDVFICYKETDAQGRRTPDSVLANELYHELTKEGFKVFFSRITLEDKLGTAYEPYIFAALNSARVMVALGTKPEYFNAVWVKNEWSRYLALIRSGTKKNLIPAYRDMDPYDLPEEFSHLQAQDMSKLGFMPDLIRGVKKLLGTDEPKEPAKETVVVQQSPGGANITAQLKRGVQALEDKDWAAANGFFDKALDMDAECAEAFFGKALAEEKCSSAEDFIQKRLSIPVKKTEVLTACERDSERVERAIKEYTIPGYLDDKTIRSYYSYDERSYDSLTKAWQNRLKDEEAFWSTSRTLSRAVRFAENPLASKLKEIRNKIDEALKAKLAESESLDQQAAQQTRERYAQRIDKAEAALVKEYDEKSKVRKAEYDRVCLMQKSAKTADDYDEAARLFESIRLHGYEDCDERAEQCRTEAEKIVAADAKAAAAKKKKKTTIGIASAAVIVIAVAAVVLTITVIIPTNKYKAAEGLLASGDYDGAVEAFERLGDFKDSPDRILESIYAKAEAQFSAGEYNRAIDLFAELEGFQDSADRILECKYAKAEALLTAGDYDRAIVEFAALRPNADVDERIKETRYVQGSALFSEKDYAGAITCFTAAGDYKDSNERVKEVRYAQAEAMFANEEYSKAIAEFESLGEYSNSAKRLEEIRAYVFELANEAFENEDYPNSIGFLMMIPEYQGVQDRLEIVKEQTYKEAVKAHQEKNDKQASVLFNSVEGYLDADDYISYYSIKETKYDDGEIHDLATDYERIMSIKNEGLQDELLLLPQMQTLLALEGAWYYEGYSGKDTTWYYYISRGQITYVNDEYKQKYRLLYKSGSYYIQYLDDNDYDEISGLGEDHFYEEDVLTLDEGKTYQKTHRRTYRFVR